MASISSVRQKEVTMDQAQEIHAGMPVYGIDGRKVGPVEAADAQGFRAAHQPIPYTAVDRVIGGVVHLRLAATALAARPDPPLDSPRERLDARRRS
jgi:hypothetical protein